MNLLNPFNCVTFNFQRATRALVRGFERSLKDIGLSAPQFTSLSLLSGFGEMTVGQLAARLGTERTTLTRNLEVMQAKGWIEPVGSRDLRQHAVRLTDQGRACLQAAMPIWVAHQSKLVAALGADFSENLLETLQKL
jgi:DNA-binding MarR family transcriptional regulator